MYLCLVSITRNLMLSWHTFHTAECHGQRPKMGVDFQRGRGQQALVIDLSLVSYGVGKSSVVYGFGLG